MGGEITLQDALERVQSTSVKQRGDGVADLKHILRSNKRFDNLSDGSFHRIYEALFGFVLGEQSTYLKAKTTATRSAAENRLSLCASTLRLAVDSGVRYIRLKTVRSTFDHIIQTLRLSNGKFCEPIALDYAKSLRSIINHQPHVEHLTKDDRESIATFCVECINISEADLNGDASSSAESASMLGNVNGLSYRSSRSTYKDSADSQGIRSLAKSIADEMVAVISLLTAIPNASPGSKASDLLSALISVLQSSTIGGSSNQDAFSAINHILSWIRTEEIELVKKKTNALVRLVRNYWPVKTSDDVSTSELRNELLICLIYLRPYIFSAMQHQNNVALRSELRGCFEAIKNAYSNRSERQQLDIDDLRLDFTDVASDMKMICTAVFSIQSGKAKSETNWATVYVLATICSVLSDRSTNDTSSDDEEDEGDRPRKRPRLSDDLDDLLLSSIGESDDSRACALQILAFLSQQMPFSTRQLAKAIDKVCQSCADDNTTVSSWAMLALASFASQAGSATSSLSSRWASVWQIATRAMSNASNCRAACHLMLLLLEIRLIPQNTVSEFIRTMTSSVDLNGPSLLADSVAHLLIFVVKTSQRTNPTSSNATAESVLSWTFRHFWPSKSLDRYYASQSTVFEPEDIVGLVFSCLAYNISATPTTRFPLWASVAQAIIECSKQRDLVNYLLLLPEPASVTHKGLGSEKQVSNTSSQARTSCEAITLSHLTSEIHRAQEEWNQLVREKARGLSTDGFRMLCKTCLSTTFIAFAKPFQDVRRQNQLQKQITELLRTMADFISGPHCSQEEVDVMLSIFSSACHGLFSSEPQLETSACEKHICEFIVKAMSARKSHRELNSIDEDDGMEFDDDHDTQESGARNQQDGRHNLRAENTAIFGAPALEVNVKTYATVIAARNRFAVSVEDGNSTLSAQVIDYLLSLSEASMLISSNVISSLSNLGVDIDTNDCYRLLDHCAEKILGSYTYERSEVALGAILHMMSSLASALTNDNNEHLHELGIDMYNWYTSVALRGGVLSPCVQERVAAFLLQLCYVNTDYGRDDKNNVPSVRTSLFKLIELGNITSQFFLANRVSTIFGLFVLSNHSAMFEDLQTSLPADSDWVEGMAMRLLFLTNLASAWHSLLRQCVYYIFETAGRIKKTTEHAARTINTLAASLGFKSPRNVFELFAPQLLHTWLESQPVTYLPFAIFQYESLRQLIEQNESEIVAQLLIRGDDAGMALVQETLKIGGKDLVVRSFAKCLAYSIGWDTTRSSAESKEAKCDSRLRKLIGTKEEYKPLVAAHFAASMGHLFISLQQEDVHDRWLEKREQYAPAAKALTEMKKFSHSERVLPTSQQPCFKSKYLCDEIERLYRRTPQDFAEPLESSSFSVAARMLLDSIEDALGPLHTCLVIRKLRLLICVAGKVALTGFPLEMLIHTLRPFLADSQCADDVMGVLQYLFHHGREYLKANLPFLHGTVISMILQMQKHSRATLDSTTQESQHKSTVQTMQNFQAWLVDYLQDCQPSAPSSESRAYATAAKALRNINLPGNAVRGTSESALLLFLITENPSYKHPISDADRKEALILLSNNFQPPAALAEDCLENDSVCVRAAESLWYLIQTPGLGEAFIAWSATVLGRAYASSGRRPLSSTSEDRKRSHDTSVRYEGIDRSQATIARRLSDLLLSRNRTEASFADFTLRNILTSFKDEGERLAFKNMLPASLDPALEYGTQGYEPFRAPDDAAAAIDASNLHPLTVASHDTTLEAWAQSMSLALCQRASDTAIFPALRVALQNSHDLALELFPCIVHILLAKELESESILRAELSNALEAHFAIAEEALHPKQQYLVRLLLYLREQPIPGERTPIDRLNWLDVDWLSASQAANRCDMPTAALLFAESISAPISTQSGRRSSRVSISQASISQIPQDLLLAVFRGVEEPDSYYGVEQSASLGSILSRLDYEGDGYQSLMFRSAQTDVHLRQSHQLTETDAAGMVRSLSVLNLTSLTFTLLSGGFGSLNSNEELLNTARRLQQWDIVPAEDTFGVAANTFSALRELSRATDRASIQIELRSILLKHVQPVTKTTASFKPSNEWFSALSSLTEISETIEITGPPSVQAVWKRMQERQSWMRLGKYNDFQMILSNRHTLFSVLALNRQLTAAMHCGVKECRSLEVESLLTASRLARQHGQLQEALATANQCSDLLRDNKDSMLKAEGAVKVEVGSVLWDMGEITASVNMLQSAYSESEAENQDTHVGRSGLLAQLAHQLAEARLEKPDEILARYLKPAIDQLQGRSQGEEAGKVYHEFASFCDKQLQNPGNVEDFNRIAKIRQRKLEEVQELERLSKNSKKSTVEREAYYNSLKKAKKWLHIDDADYQRLKTSREKYIQLSLEYYLRALQASDDHDISILRFFALWLENSDVPLANGLVSKYLPGVPSWKFVVLMNQLMSRLEQDGSIFQAALTTLATRICSDHPYHSLHHLYASTREPSSQDQAAISRFRVARDIQRKLHTESKDAKLMGNIFRANDRYNELAASRPQSARQLSRLSVKDLQPAYAVAVKIPELRVPPATISLPLQPSCNYENVPHITKFESVYQVMSGKSAPKRLTAYASNGKPYAQLFKDGDDLRQDAIMEQVFGEVSKMLQNHKPTRQRNLHVRTYKVIPLSNQSGIIEFVPNSISFNDFLHSAHERYHPQDIKVSAARSKVQENQDQSTATRVKEFQKVCDRLQPVMRHFFFERFKDPDEWFEKRTAYTRTTATISILGHVLGLGDRHCQNIMLDKRTGEVVHIDLGIAFEAGRILPVPELVPFRLTRDVIDGMGITRTEGVFRRCCEFTMDALREDKDSIMTLLNVLRYDPLYTWTVSPLRAKRLQDQSGQNAPDPDGVEGSSKRKEGGEAGEADRALSIVEKKLSKTLSTAATVNELIQQATDVRNLATLYYGWAAYL